MKKCRCCRNYWPLAFYKTDRARNGWRSPRCEACYRNCGVHRRRRAVERTRAWKAALVADLERIRLGRAA